MPKYVWTPELKEFIANEFAANRISPIDSPASVRYKYPDKFGHFKPGTFSRVYTELKNEYATGMKRGGSASECIFFDTREIYRCFDQSKAIKM